MIIVYDAIPTETRCHECLVYEASRLLPQESRKRNIFSLSEIKLSVAFA